MKFLDDLLLKKCAEASLLSYKKGEDGSQKQKWMEVVEFLGDNDDKVVFVKESTDPDNYRKKVRIFFAFRGTDVSNIRDLWNNANILKSILSDVTIGNDGGKFHEGFKGRSKICLEQILVKLEQLSCELEEYESMDMYEIIFCGHSLGGAAAAVSTIRLRTKKSKLKKFETKVERESIMVIEGEDRMDLNINLTQQEQDLIKLLPFDITCVTFGAPSFGNKINQEYCIKKKLSTMIYNVIHINDLIPKILYRVIPDKLKPRFIINAKAAIGNFQILFDDKRSEEFKFEHFLAVEEYIKKENYKHTKDHHGIRNYLRFFSKEDYGSSILDVITRTNNDLRAMGYLYQANDKIGKGTYGFVMKGIHINDRTLVAIKKTETNPTSDKKIEVEQKDNDGKVIKSNPELSTLNKIKHKNIVEMYDYCIHPENKTYLFLELCESDLHNFIKTEGFLDEPQLSLILKDCLSGIQEMHEKGIIHRDLKPANILVAKRNEGKSNLYKIADLGSTSLRGGKTTAMTVCGTTLYMSPELYEAFTKSNLTVRLNPQTDIFSIAATILYCGKKDHPWTEYDLNHYVFKDDKYVEEIVNKVALKQSNVFKDILKDMLKINFHSRSKASTLLMKEYFK